MPRVRMVQGWNVASACGSTLSRTMAAPSARSEAKQPSMNFVYSTR